MAKKKTDKHQYLKNKIVLGAEKKFNEIKLHY